jgi:hypothetical protein
MSNMGSLPMDARAPNSHLIGEALNDDDHPSFLTKMKQKLHLHK